jgi:hypothetical protein
VAIMVMPGELITVGAFAAVIAVYGSEGGWVRIGAALVRTRVAFTPVNGPTTQGNVISTQRRRRKYCPG